MTNQQIPATDTFLAFHAYLSRPQLDLASEDFDTSAYFDRFSEEHHASVEEALVYYGHALSTGELSNDEFDDHVRLLIAEEAEQRERERAAQELFDKVESLIDSGKIPEPHHTRLSQEIARGQGSLLLLFIRKQDLHSPLDAAVSFLAWDYTRKLFELEQDFSVNLDEYRDQRDYYWFSRYEALEMKCFSLAAKQQQQRAHTE